MSLTTPKLALGLLFSLTALNAQAALTSYYTAVGNIPVVYSSVSNVTWTQDANLFKTMYDADNSLISQIASVTPSYNDPDPFWGVQTIDAGDFNTGNGRLTWWGGLAFTHYLNSINYGGSSQWRLPSADFNTGSELGQLFYSELGGTHGNSIPNTPTFNNEQSSMYWLAPESAPDPGSAWFFYTGSGIQFYDGKYYQGCAWAVSPGQVAAVPVPGAVWLMGSALIGLLASKRRGHAG